MTRCPTGSTCHMNITANKLLLFASAAFFTVAALCVGVSLGLGPAWGWGFGGFAAWVLAAALP